MKKVSIIGLGYVGSVLSLVCALAKDKKKLLYNVYGIEKNKKLVQKFCSGVFPFDSKDNKIKDNFKKVNKQGNLKFSDKIDTIKNSKIIIITINIDVTKRDYIKQLNNFTKLFKEVCLRVNNSLIVIESTVPPGFCSKILYPILNKIRLKKKSKIYLCHSYERVMPGEKYLDSVINNFRVYSSDETLGEKKGKNFLKTILNYKKFPLTKMDNTLSSETSKILENSYRALNIAFIDDWTKFSMEHNIDLFKIINAIKKRPTHSNLMFPGLGVGGYCLTKDPLFIHYSNQKIFKNKKFKFNFNRLSVQINEKMPNFVIDILKKNIKVIKKKNFLLLGAAYKSDISDTRNSASKNIYDFLKKNKANIDFYDPYVKNWSETKLKSKNLSSLKKSKYQCIIFLTSHSFFKKNFINKLNLNNRPLILDANMCLTDPSIKKLKLIKKIKFIRIGGWS